MASPLSPLLTAPVANAQVGNSGNVRFAWTYRHPDPSKTQAKSILRRRVPGGAYEYWSGAVWNATSTNYIVNTNAYYDIAASNFTLNTAYLVSVAVQDSSAVNSAYCDEQMLKVVALPTVTVFTTNTDLSFPRISWEYAHDAGLPQTRYRVAVYTAAQYGAGGFVPFVGDYHWQTDWVEDEQTYQTDMTTEVASGTTYKAYVQCETFTALRTAATASSTFTPNIVLPEAPTASLAADNALGELTLTMRAAFNLLTDDESDFTTSLGGWTSMEDATVDRFDESPQGFVMRMTSAGVPYSWWLDQAAYDTYTEFSANALTDTYSETTALMSNPVLMRASTELGAAGKAVVVGTKYSAAFRAKRLSGTANVTASIYFYTAGGVFVSSHDGTPTSVGTAAYVDVKVENITAPATAAFAALVVSCAITGLGEVVYVDKAVLNIGATSSFSPGGYGANAALIVERFNEYSQTWVPVHGYSRQFPGASHEESFVYAVVKDKCVPLGTTTTIQYRAYATSTDISGLASVVSLLAYFNFSAGIPGQSWWLRDPLDPDRDTAIASTEFSPSFTMDAEVSKPIGRLSPVAMYLDTPIYNSFSLSMWSDTEAELKRLLILLQSRRTLYVQTSNALGFYVRVVGDVNYTQEMAMGTPAFYVNKHLFKIVAPVIEVAPINVKYTMTYPSTQTWSEV